MSYLGKKPWHYVDSNCSSTVTSNGFTGYTDQYGWVLDYGHYQKPYVKPLNYGKSVEELCTVVGDLDANRRLRDFIGDDWIDYTKHIMISPRCGKSFKYHLIRKIFYESDSMEHIMDTLVEYGFIARYSFVDSEDDIILGALTLYDWVYENVIRFNDGGDKISRKERYVKQFEKLTGFDFTDFQFRMFFVRDDFYNDFNESDKTEMVKNFDEMIRIFRSSDTVEEALSRLSKTSCLHSYSSTKKSYYVPLDFWIFTMFLVKMGELDGTEHPDCVKDEIHKFFEKRKDEKSDSMSLSIRKTDILTVDEFKETEKAYEKVFLKINKETYDKFTEEYGKPLFDVTDDYTVELNGYTIEFKEKAIRVYGSLGHSFVPYTFIDSVECVYHLEK